MRDEELKHKSTLENILNTKQLPNWKKYTPDEDLKIADYVVDIDIKKGDLSYKEILVVAMKREKATIDIYQDLADNLENPDLIEIFNFLINEESKHKHFFEAEFDDHVYTSD